MNTSKGDLDRLNGRPSTSGSSAQKAKIGSIVKFAFTHEDPLIVMIVEDLNDHFIKLPEGVRAISYKTPIAKALMGRTEGQKGTVTTLSSSGKQLTNTLTILKVS